MNLELPPADRRFLELVEANRPKILKICRVYAWNREDQDDLYQEILFQIWRGLPTLRQNAYAGTWIYRTALNTAMSFVRKHKRQKDQTVQVAHEEMDALLDKHQAHVPETNPELAKLYEAIAKLDAMEKALITLFLEDLSYAEIAEVMGIGVSHVGVVLHRAKKKLSTLMEARHE